MKVLRCNKPGGLDFTPEILKWLKDNCKDVTYGADQSLKDAVENEDLIILGHTEKLRTHPLLIDAFTKFPNDSAVFNDVNGDYFKIISYDSGVETIISPAIENFTQGYDQKNSKALLIEKLKSTMENYKIERTEKGVKIGETEIEASKVRVVKADMTVRELRPGDSMEIQAKSMNKIGDKNYVFDGAHLSITLD